MMTVARFACHDVRRMMTTGPNRDTVRLVMWSLVIVAIVVPWWSWQPHPHWARIRWVPFVSPPITIHDIIGNILLYVPYGYFAASLSQQNRLSVGILGAIVISAGTEMTQVFAHGRFPSVQDMLTNVLGAAIGLKLGKWRYP